MVQIALMLGGNLPDTAAEFKKAVSRLADAGVENIRCSTLYTSAAEDCVAGTPDFLDMAVVGTWGKSAEELLNLCQQLETAAGRPQKHSSRESRILDCDIILFGDAEYKLPHLVIPHPRAEKRHFVMFPLAEVAPDMRFPDGRSTAEILRSLQNA